MFQRFSDYKNEFSAELVNIADWWVSNTLDEKHGGFIGETDNELNHDLSADKSLVLNTRILWFFSEAADLLGEAKYREMAERAYHYLIEHFRDNEHGGYVWQVDYQGSKVSTRKQVYGQSFVIYALSAYYHLTKQQSVLDEANIIFELLEKHAFDRVQGGYFEAFTQDWQPIDDLRLSEKDLNHPKTMNTHLHVLEAYTGLHRINPTEDTRNALERVLTYFENNMIDQNTQHLRMFLDNECNDHSTAYSYGHDIEASWLIWEALEVLSCQPLLNELRPAVLGLAQSCLEEAITPSGAVFDELEFSESVPAPVHPWWVQAEALVGFFNAYELTGDKQYFSAMEHVWQFIQNQVIDTEFGEWLWFSRCSKQEYCAEAQPPYKAGSWKGPYHNGRAMIELYQRLDKAMSAVNKSA